MAVTPLISAIMPARGRSEMAAAAVECWRRQTWQNTELLILDDADCPAFPAEAARAAKFCPENGWESPETAILGATAGSNGLMASNWPDSTFLDGDGPNGRRIAYFCLPKRLTIGAKRNLACWLARGEFVAHIDSDDCSGPDRLTDQITRLLESGKAVTGYHSLLFTNGSSWWRYDGQVFSGIVGNVRGVFGTSLLYRKDWWQKHPFVAGPKDFRDYEDRAFVLAAVRDGQLIEAPAADMMYARVHPDNSSPKGIGDPVRWKRVAEPSWQQVTA